MSIEVISTLKPKNNGGFPVVEAEDVTLKNGRRAEEVFQELDRVTLKKAIIYYGYPIAINGVWTVEEACNIYKKYEIVVFGDEYNEPSHETHANTKEIIRKLKVISPKTKVTGYVPIGCIPGNENSNMTMEQIKRKIDLWADMGTAGIFLDEYGYDYRVTRARQNEIVSYVKNMGMFVFVNSWEHKYIFSDEPMVLDWLEGFQPNPDGLPCLLDENDYSLFENLFFSVEKDGETYKVKCASPWRIDDAYAYYNRAGTDGKTYHEKYGTNMVALDAVPSGMDRAHKNILQTISLFGSRILNIPFLAIGDEHWGASGYYNDWDLPDIDMSETAAQGFHSVTVENRTYSDNEGTIQEFPYKWSAIIHGQRYTVVFDIPEPEHTAWVDGMRYACVNDVVVENAWMTVYDFKADMEEAAAAASQARETIDRAIPELQKTETEVKASVEQAEQRITAAEEKLEAGMKDLETVMSGFQYRERQW